MAKKGKETGGEVSETTLASELANINLWYDRRNVVGTCNLDAFEANQMAKFILKNYDVAKKSDK